MKKIKILICILLIAAGFLFNGDLFMLYIDGFQESHYKATFDFRGVEEEEKVIKDFIDAGNENGVDFFMIKSRLLSSFEKEIIIYGTEGSITELKAKGLDESEYGSIFFGKTKIKYKPFDEISDLKEVKYCYFMGDESKFEDMREFKVSLVEKYYGGFPKLYGSEKETWMNILTVWLIIFGIILMLTAYEILFQKRENMVRIILGEDLRFIFIKSLAMDIIGLLAIFLIVPLFLHKFSNVYFKYSFISKLFVAVLFIVFLLNLLILRVRFKRDMGDGGSGARVLLFSNYAIKAITTALVILVLSGNLYIVSESYNLYKQRDFFEEHKDYQYYQLPIEFDIENIDKQEEIIKEFHRLLGEFDTRFSESHLKYIDMSNQLGIDYPTILINDNAIFEMAQKWPQIEELVSAIPKDSAYLLFPDDMSVDSREYKTAKEIYYFATDSYADEEEILTYEKGIAAIGVIKGDNFDTTYYKDPIIIYDNRELKNEKYYNMEFESYFGNIMYKVKEDDFDRFVEEKQLNTSYTSRTGVLDVYEYNWTIRSRSGRMAIILSVMLAFLETTLIVFIIRLEYRINAIEMALMKVHGYTLMDRNQRIIILTILSSLVGLALSMVMNNEMDMKAGKYIAIIAIGFMVIELVYIMIKARSIESRRISSILKGERI